LLRQGIKRYVKGSGANYDRSSRRLTHISLLLRSPEGVCEFGVVFTFFIPETSRMTYNRRTMVSVWWLGRREGGLYLLGLAPP
jgi:hypothetical protein